MKKTFDIHVIEGYISNVTLAVYPHGILCIDSGSRPDVKLIYNYVTETLSRPASDIKLCFVSHMHPDHSGGAMIMKRLYGIPVAAHPLVNRWYSGPTGWFQHRLDCTMQQHMRKLKSKPVEPVLFSRTMELDHILEDGDVLPFFPDWKALHVPGHTTHDIAIYNEKAEMAYTADCIVNVKGKLFLPMPVLFRGRMINSLNRLAALDLKTIIPAHGPIITGAELDGIFTKLIDSMEMPKNRMGKISHNLGSFSPEVWKAYLRKWRDRRFG